MALKGNLRDFSFYQLLNLIHLAHKTGALTIRSQNGRSGGAYLYFQEGKLVHAALDGRPARLTDVLLQVGKITPEQAQMVSERSRVDTDKELGLILLHAGLLNRGDIIQGVRSYLLDTVYHLFTVYEGDFVFEQNHLPPEERLAMPINLENLILEGDRRQQEWDKLRQEIPDLEVPVRFVHRPKVNPRSISLDADQWKLISNIDSHRTIRQLGQLTGMDDFQVRRVLLSLCRAGLIETVLVQEVKPTPVPAKPAPAARVNRNLIQRLIDGIRRR